MVYLKVLVVGGIDFNEWQGFVFGIGIDCLVMLKYGIFDLCVFFDVDLCWLCYYGFVSFDQLMLYGGLIC